MTDCEICAILVIVVERAVLTIEVLRVFEVFGEDCEEEFLLVGGDLFGGHLGESVLETFGV